MSSVTVAAALSTSMFAEEKAHTVALWKENTPMKEEAAAQLASKHAAMLKSQAQAAHAIEKLGDAAYSRYQFAGQLMQADWIAKDGVLTREQNRQKADALLREAKILVEEAEANVSCLLLVQLRYQVRHCVERDLCACELSLGLLARALLLFWPCLRGAVSEGSG